MIAVCCCFLVRAPARGEDDRVAQAQTLFARGVEQTGLGAWREAAELFERSRALYERPATVLNLVIAYDQLGDPLAVVRSVRDLLRISDPVRHRVERQQSLELEARAYEHLARLHVTVTPPEARIEVDGEEAVYTDDHRAVLAVPGEHELRFHAPGYVPAIRHTRVQRDDTSPLTLELARASEPEEVRSLALHIPRTPWRTTDPGNQRTLRGTAIGLAALGTAIWLGGFAAQSFALAKSKAIARRSPDDVGFISLGDALTRSRRAVAPLAFSGALLAATGVLLRARRGRELPRKPLYDWLLVGVLASSLAAGVTLCVLDRPAVGASALEVTRREGGYLLLSTSLPALASLISRALAR